MMTDESGARRAVLLVEDVSMVRRTLALILKSGGYEVVEASDAASALAILRQKRKVDLVLADIMMPGMDGLEFCRTLRSDPSHRDIPVILCSARSDPKAVMEAKELGVIEFIVKPFSRSTVWERIARLP
jgi:CheY-like chemotaxis protein